MKDTDFHGMLKQIYDRLGWMVLWLFFIMVAACEIASKM